MEGFRELHNNTVSKKHDSQNNTPLNITPLTHVSDGLYIECPPRGHVIGHVIFECHVIRLGWQGIILLPTLLDQG
jgi:hypothetical protein